MGMISSLCKKGLVLKNGGVSYQGSSVDAVNYYLKNFTVEYSSRVIIPKKKKKIIKIVK
jgi:ABC-type polysaccharide/polyol phosphate transport system ATPase subunit